MFGVACRCPFSGARPFGTWQKADREKFTRQRKYKIFFITKFSSYQMNYETNSSRAAEKSIAANGKKFAVNRRKGSFSYTNESKYKNTRVGADRYFLKNAVCSISKSFIELKLMEV